MAKRTILRTIYLVVFFSIAAWATDSDKHKVDSIKVIGNEVTKEYIITNELTFAVGDSVTMDDLVYNKDRIFSLGIFNQVNLYFDSVQTTSLYIEVKEAWYIWPIPFAELVDRDWSKITYGVDLFIKNFRGMNENFRIRASLGYNPGFRFIYSIPYLYKETGIFASVQLQSDKFTNPSNELKAQNGTDFTVKHQGIITSVGKRFNTFTWFSGTASFDHFSYPSWIRSNQPKDYSIPSFSATYVYDTRNLIQFPTEGKYISSAVTYRGFTMHNFNFAKYSAEWRNYLPLQNRWTLKSRLAVYGLIGSEFPAHDYIFHGYGEKTRGHFSELSEGNFGVFTSVECNYPLIKDWQLNFNFPIIPRKLQSYQISIYPYFFMDASNIRKFKQDILLDNTFVGVGTGIAFVVLPYRVSSLELAFNEKGKYEILFQLDVPF